MRQHPLSKTLIEKQDRRNWRVVERETTRRGLSPRAYSLVEGNLETYEGARKVFDRLRRPHRNGHDLV